MMQTWSKLWWIAVLAGAVVAGWNVWWPSDEKRILKLLASLASDASVSSRGGALADAAAANRVADHFAPEFEINVSGPGVPDVSITHRSELVQAVMTARGQRQGVRIELLDPRVVRLESDTAVVDATARAQSPGEREPFIAEVRFTLARVESRWRVSKVENVRTFE